MKVKFDKGFVFSIPLVICFVSVAFSASYYVDADNGNDQWDGHTQTYEGGTRGPWRTGIFASLLSPGDQVLFKRGTTNLYITRFVNYWNGTVSNPIVFGAWGNGEKPILCPATRANNGWSDIGGGKYSHAAIACAVLLEDLEAIDIASNSDLTDGNWHFSSGIIYYRPSSGVPNDHDLRYVDSSNGNSVAISLYQGASYIIIKDLRFVGSNINTFPTSEKNRVHDLTIQRCDFSDTCADAIYLVSRSNYKLRNVIITDCTFNFCLNNIYVVAQDHGAAEDITIQRNRFLHSNLMRGTGNWDWAGGGDRDGISLQNIKDSTIEHNEVSGLCDRGGGITIWFDSAYLGTGNIIRYNYVHDVTGGGIIWGGEDVGHCNAKIYGNIITNAGLTTQSLNSWSDAIQGYFKLVNSKKAAVSTKVFDVTENGKSLTKQISAKLVNENAGSWYWDGTDLYVRATSGYPESNCKSYIARKVYANPGGQAGGITLNRVQTSETPTTVYNNVVYHCNVNYCLALGDYFILKNNISLDPVQSHTMANVGIMHNVLDYNCYYPATGGAFNYAYKYNIWKAWKTLTGQESHSIISNPQFINAATGDFRLNSGSPCIKAGTSMGTVNDYFGNKFRSNPSIGAIEYYKTSEVLSPKAIGGSNYGVE